MKEKELKNRLQQTFRLDIWKEILPLFFKKVDYFTRPESLFSENEKVIEGKQIGTVKLDDGKQLAIFVVEVADNISILRNRIGLREIAAKYIDQNIIHGALTFFFNKSQDDYRFSFISKESNLDMETGELIKDETKPKRYTFLLGANEACTTPAKRLMVLADKKENVIIDLKQLKEVFSVEALNKDFFKSYKTQYEKFWKYLAEDENSFKSQLIDTEKEAKEKQEKPIRDFVKKLLGRIVFLYFLQKKGWMGCPARSSEYINGDLNFMRNLFQNFSKKENFHSKCLTVLFFKTLNTKRLNDIFSVDGLEGNLNGSKVPYLNGGLFEPEKNPITGQIDFPVDYFNDLLEFFDQYNFTIDENSPDDEEVGIDPEMLGHIFENLLEENREKGAFYTPKEIVQYMCKESLIQYLLNTFSENKEDIEQFIRTNTVSNFLRQKDNAILLNQKLEDIKVCDPAIGSGAFPIGMLQEIFEAKRFIYPYLKTLEPFDPAKEKKNIIQNSIYGVDLEKGAVDIAQLRFWLALVVEEKAPCPLPNLDYKIMQGNSLLEQYNGIDLSKIGTIQNDIKIVEPKRDLFGNILDNQMKITFANTENTQKIQQLIKKFFTRESAEEKKEIRSAINKLVLEYIEFNIELRENQLIRNINEAGDPDKLSKNARKKYESLKDDLAHLQESKQSLLKIQQTDERPYFLWHLYFMEVFDQGGFDVMLGNPPYIQLQKMNTDTDILQDVGFDTFVRTGDIYCLFYEKGIDLLKPKGTLSYITSNTWMRTKFGENLREYFTENCNPISLLNFEDTQIFPSATVEANILVAKSEQWNKNVRAVVIKGDYKVGTSINDYLKKNGIYLSDLSKDSWNILSKGDYEIKNRITFIGKQLKDWDIHFYRGFLTGYNDAFFIDEEKKNEIIRQEPQASEFIKPFLRGRNIKKYSYIFDNIYVLFIPWHFPLQNDNSISGASVTAEKEFLKCYPILYKHLLEYKDSLSSRNKSETGIRYEWYSLQRAAATYRDEFDKEKLVWLSISDKPAFALDRASMYVTAPAYIMTSHCNKYLMTILNSKIMEWYLDKVSSSTGVGTNQWSKIFVEQLPIPEIDESKRRPFEIIAEYLLFVNDPSQKTIFHNNSNDNMSNVFDDIANMMVYELYFENELKFKEIDILQFINFPDISKIDNPEDKKNIIQKVYYELQEKDNPIRNRLLVASSRSEIIARINASTN